MAFFFLAAMPTPEFLMWGWRIPFLFSALLVIVGMVIRLELEESDAMKAVLARKKTVELPIGEVLRKHWVLVLLVAGEIFVVMRRHDPSAFPAELDFCTSPSPVRAREAGVGIMPRGRGVTKVFTSLGVLSRSGPFDELELTSIHRGATVDEVRAATGWDLKISDALTVTEDPTAAEVDLLRNEIDKVRLYPR